VLRDWYEHTFLDFDLIVVFREKLDKSETFSVGSYDDRSRFGPVFFSGQSWRIIDQRCIYTEATIFERMDHFVQGHAGAVLVVKPLEFRKSYSYFL